MMGQMCCKKDGFSYNNIIMKKVFLLLDPQCDFFSDENPNLLEFKKTVPVINRVLQYFRERSQPVIVIQHTSAKLSAHSPGWKIHPGIALDGTEILMRKHFQNAFWKSQLAKTLHALQAQDLLIAGYLAERCVLSTYRGAIERGFKPVLLADGSAGVQHPEAVLDWCDTLRSKDVFSGKFLDKNLFA
jgi:nicotinamidase-related amidase